MRRVADIAWAGLKLHIGCGARHLPPPWVNTDGVEAPLIQGRVCLSPDVLLDICHDLAEIPTASLIHVYWAHGPEHMHNDLLPGILAELARVLRPGGPLTLSTIDLTGIFHNSYEKGGSPQDWNAVLYGDAKSTDVPFMAHRQVFTYAWLAQLVREAGFGEVHPWALPQYPEIAALLDHSSTSAPYSTFVEGVR